MFWVGSDANSIESFNFNNAANWKQRAFSDGHYYYKTPSSSPSSNDSVSIGGYNAADVPTIISPCLFGGYSGSASYGTWNDIDAAGGTHSSGLQTVNLGNPLNNNGAYSTAYPFPYMGTGIAGDTLNWVLSGWSGQTAGIVDTITAVSQLPLRIKASVFIASTIGVADTKVQFDTVKNFSSFGSMNGATAPFGVQTQIDLISGWRRSGDLCVSSGYASSINHWYAGAPGQDLKNNGCSESFSLKGVTAGIVKLTGSPSFTIDDKSNIGKLDVNPGYWIGPVIVGGNINRNVFNELNAGLSGATGGTSGTYYGALTVKPLSNMLVMGASSKVAPYNTTVVGSADLYGEGPFIIIGNGSPLVGLTAGSITVQTCNVDAGNYGTWGVRLGSSITMNDVTLNGVILRTTQKAYTIADDGMTSDQQEVIAESNPILGIQSTDRILISSLKIGKGTILDFTTNPDFKNWSFGAVNSSGSILGGIQFLDNTTMIAGLQDMKFTNDVDIAGGKWSLRNNTASFNTSAVNNTTSVIPQ